MWEPRSEARWRVAVGGPLRFSHPGSGAARSCANALPLWRAVLHATAACVPDCWPQLLEPLQGGEAAARAAGDEAAAREFASERRRVLEVLNPSCDDVRRGVGVNWC